MYTLIQKQPSRGGYKKSCSENMQSDFIEIALQHGCSPVNLLHSVRTPFFIVRTLWTAVSVNYIQLLQYKTLQSLLFFWYWHFFKNV